MTDRQWAVAALHGYRRHFRRAADASERGERPLSRRPAAGDPARLATWVGELKRHRRAILDRDIAKRIRAIPADDENRGLTSFIPLIKYRLGEEAWSVVIDACDEILAKDAPAEIEVVYEWTCDAERPWRGERVDQGSIVLHGPLLDFPADEAAFWNDKAEDLWSETRQDFTYG